MPAITETRRQVAGIPLEVQTREPAASEAYLRLVNYLIRLGKRPNQQPHRLEWFEGKARIELIYPNLKQPVRVTLSRESPHLRIQHPLQWTSHKLDEPFSVYRVKITDARSTIFVPTIHDCTIFRGVSDIIILESWGDVKKLPADLTRIPGISFLPVDWETKLKPKVIVQIPNTPVNIP